MTSRRLANGRYELIEQVRGGAAEVHRANDSRLGLMRTITIVADHMEDAENRALLVRDSESLSKLEHPNLVPVQEARNDHGGVFVVTSSMERGSVEEHLLALGPLPPSLSAQVAIGVLRALEAAHEVGVLHRGLGVENVMIDAQSEVRVTDFGLTLLTGQSASPAPEQAGEPAAGDERTDIYAVGAMLLDMLGGASGKRTPLAELVGFARKCMQADPEERYQTAAEARAALEAMDLPPDPPSTPQLGSPRPLPKELPEDDDGWEVDPEAATVLRAPSKAAFDKLTPTAVGLVTPPSIGPAPTQAPTYARGVALGGAVVVVVVVVVLVAFWMLR